MRPELTWIPMGAKSFDDANCQMICGQFAMVRIEKTVWLLYKGFDGKLFKSPEMKMHEM